MAGPAASTTPEGARRLRWGAEALQARLEPLLPGLAVEVVGSAGSTNTVLLERARLAAAAGGTMPPALLVAERQTSGRGRLGRSWQSDAATSLTFSLALAFEPQDWSGLSLAVGVALAEALQAPAGPRIALKWPNDLWLVDAGAGTAQGRKLGGVLIETVAAGRQRVAVIGVGLNAAPLPPSLTSGLARPTGCLQELECGIDAPAALGRVAAPLARAVVDFERAGFGPFVARFAALDVLRDQAITTGDPGAPSGVARGVDARGGLRVETAGGLHVAYGGEVSVRPAGVTLPARAWAESR